VQVKKMLETIHEYHRQYDTLSGAYVPQSIIFDRYLGDAGFESFALAPEVSNTLLSKLIAQQIHVKYSNNYLK